VPEPVEGTDDGVEGLVQAEKLPTATKAVPDKVVLIKFRLFNIIN
jgi:hypothetical protein